MEKAIVNLRHPLDNEDKVGSSEHGAMDTILVLNKPGMWQFPTDPELCCIYRVPSCLREVNPEAYTPQLVLIGPLHHSLKIQALKFAGDMTNDKLMGNVNMEEHKKKYLVEFAKRLQDEQSIEIFRGMIQEDEAKIRASYSESTDWIEAPEFVEMILRDAVFIMELILRTWGSHGCKKIGDPLVDKPCLEITVKRDLILLENQLPYFILEKLFYPLVPSLLKDMKLRELIVAYFKLYNVEEQSSFVHFTDLVRFDRVDEVTPDDDCGEVGPRGEWWR